MAEQPPDKLAVYLSTMQASSFPKLSSIELDDIRIPGLSPMPPLEEESHLNQASVFHCGYKSMDWASDVRRPSRIYHEEYVLWISYLLIRL